MSQTINCQECKADFKVSPCRIERKFCSKKCYVLSSIGRKFSEEHKLNISRSHKKKGVGKWMKGRKMLDETKQKIRDWSIANETYKRLTPMPNELNPNWKGDKVKYIALHAWVNRKLGKPQRCEACGLDEQGRVYDRASISREYKRDLNDWTSLCRPCHRVFDNNKLTLNELLCLKQ